MSGIKRNAHQPLIFLEPCNLIGPLIMSLGIELINYLIGLFIKTMYIETKQQVM